VHQSFIGVGRELRGKVREGAVLHGHYWEYTSSLNPVEDWSLWRGQANWCRRAGSCTHQVSVLGLVTHVWFSVG
jgi:hypothetical protein